MLRQRVLILGGYGTFGSRIAEMLTSEPGIHLIIAGHDRFKAELLASRLNEQQPDTIFEGLRLDHDAINLAAQLHGLNLDLVIHCAGPFQHQDYHVANACIENGIHYVDIADAAAFVSNIDTLDQTAKKTGTSVISGASSLPALSSAVIQELGRHFDRLDDIEINIAPAHRISRGFATVRSGFESLGSEFPLIRDGHNQTTYCGDELRKVQIGHPVGERWVCNFDVPDLRLIPEKLPKIKNLRFGTGVQPATLQAGMVLCARLARLIKPTAIPNPLPQLARLGHWLAARWPGGSEHGGMQIDLRGLSDGNTAQARWQILGLNGDGPWIPAAPAAAMARKLLRGDSIEAGASPCWQLLTLQEILAELAPHAVVTAIEKPRTTSR